MSRKYDSTRKRLREAPLLTRPEDPSSAEMPIPGCLLRRSQRWLTVVALLSIAGCRSLDRQGSAASSGAHVTAYKRAAADEPRAAESMGELWRTWGQTHLETGDIVFGMGDARIFFGLIRFSKTAAKITESRFSHTGLVVWEADDPFVYDMAPEGCRRLRFDRYVIEDEIIRFAIRRPPPQLAAHIPAAVEYVRKAYRSGVPFDRRFRPNDGCYYCTELTEQAYRSSGLALSEPVRVDAFPRYHDHRLLFCLVHLCTSIGPDHRIYIPGNESIGLFSSEVLETVYECDTVLQ